MKLKKIVGLTMAFAMTLSNINLICAMDENINISNATMVSSYATTQFTQLENTMYVKASVNGSDDNVIDKDAIGKTVVIDFDIINNKGFNNYTTFLKYNPKVVKAVKVFEPDDYTGYISYKESVTIPGVGTFNIDIPAYDAETMNKQMKIIPPATDIDYTGLADGIMSCAEFGKIRLAYVCEWKNEKNELQELEGDGRLFSVEFEVIGEGYADIELLTDEGAIFGPSPINKDKGKKILSDNFPKTIIVGKDTVAVENMKKMNATLILKDIIGSRKLSDAEKKTMGISGTSLVLDAIRVLNNS